MREKLKVIEREDMTDKELAMIMSARAIISFLQDITEGPDEAFDVLINTTMQLFRLESLNTDGTDNKEVLAERVRVLAEDWTHVYKTLTQEH